MAEIDILARQITKTIYLGVCKFKRGDKVRCMQEMSLANLRKGEIYTISKVMVTGFIYSVVLKELLETGCWSQDRFKKV